MASTVLHSKGVVTASAIVAAAIGAFVPYYSDLIGDGTAKLLLPAFIVFAILLLHDRRNMLILIIVARASGDIFLDSTKFSLGGLQVGLGGLINLFVILIATLLVFENPRRIKTQLFTIWLPFLTLTMYGVVTSPVQSDALRLWLGQLSNFAIFISAFYLVKNERDFYQCLKFVMWSSIFPVCYGIYQVIQNLSVLSSDAYRLQSTFAHANIFAFYLSIILTLTFYFLKSDHIRLSSTQKTLSGLYFCTIIALLLLTKTRNAWIVSAGSFLLYAIFFERKYFFYLFLIPTVGLLIPGISERISDLGQGNEVITYVRLNSFAWRLYLWQSALEWAEPSRYLFGYGLSSFARDSLIFFPLANVGGSPAHNVYVQLLFEVGFAGTSAYLWLFYRTTKILVSIDRFDRLAAFIVFTMFIGYLVSSLADNLLYYLSFNWYLWFIAGAGWALTVSPDAEKDSVGKHARLFSKISKI